MPITTEYLFIASMDVEPEKEALSGDGAQRMTGAVRSVS